MVTVIFVCLGNICRSPMAEAVMQKLVNEAGLAATIRVDSAGTGSWHEGERAHQGTRSILRQHGIEYNGRARQIAASDMDASHYIVAMDRSNIADLKRRFGSHSRLYRLLDFATEGGDGDVPDPYYTGNFAYVYQLVEDGCRGLLQFIRTQENL